MNLTIEQMREIVDGAPEGGQKASTYILRPMVVGVFHAKVMS